MKKYKIIYADPPWNYVNQGCNGAMKNHYEGMNIKDICSLPINGISDKDSVLFLWATYPMIKEALQVIDKWGFIYKSIAFQWIKLNKKNNKHFFGLGRWTRGNTEPCLIATKGKPKRVDASISQIVEYPIGRHSAKPTIIREKIIKLMGDIPRIELFAREKVEGWDALGNEIDGKDIRDALKEIRRK